MQKKKKKPTIKAGFLTKEYKIRPANQKDVRGSEKQESRQQYHCEELSGKARLLLLGDEQSVLSESQERVRRVMGSS
ncbi:MAG: hypothetical protein SPL63_02955 [Roseburia faecis]|nr:hypothetical protein [Roseburia faecis]